MHVKKIMVMLCNVVSAMCTERESCVLGRVVVVVGLFVCKCNDVLACVCNL